MTLSAIDIRSLMTIVRASSSDEVKKLAKEILSRNYGHSGMNMHIAPCPCGDFDLYNAPSLGIWMVAEVASEYRECPMCHSTRPYIHPYSVEGKTIRLFHDPTAQQPMDLLEVDSEQAVLRTSRWESLLEALVQGPPADVAELRRQTDNGDWVVLARAYVGIDGGVGWKVLPPWPNVIISGDE
jgi:hypothetical protein